MEDGLASARQAMTPDDPARISAEDHAAATAKSFEIRLDQLERDLKASLRAERAAASGAGPGTPGM